MQGEGEAVGVAQDKGAVRIAAGLVGIEAEVALVEAARAHLISDADPDMSEAHGSTRDEIGVDLTMDKPADQIVSRVATKRSI